MISNLRNCGLKSALNGILRECLNLRDSLLFFGKKFSLIRNKHSFLIILSFEPKKFRQYPMKITQCAERSLFLKKIFYFKVLFILICFIESSLFAFDSAETKPIWSNQIEADWEQKFNSTREKTWNLKIKMKSMLSKRQVSIIDGGFTSVTRTTVYRSKKDPLTTTQETAENDGDFNGSTLGEPWKTIGCSVRYDAWEESYEVVKLYGPVRQLENSKWDSLSDRVPVVLKNFDEFSEFCLTVEINISDKNANFHLLHPYLLSVTTIKQTSQEETAKIKEWLVGQQSGVVQGLFGHMLGDLTLNETVKVKVNVPHPPWAAERKILKKGN